jgi:hypothetical protein
MDDLQRVSATRADIDRLILDQRSFSFFVQLMAPEVYKFPYPPLFESIWRMLTDSALDCTTVRQDRYAISGSRGFIKTFMLKMLCVFIVLYTQRRTVPIICSNESKSKDFLADVAAVLRADNVRTVYGEFLEEAVVDAKISKTLQVMLWRWPVYSG